MLRVSEKTCYEVVAVLFSQVATQLHKRTEINFMLNLVYSNNYNWKCVLMFNNIKLILLS